MAKKKTYSAKDIEVLEGLQPVRKRPGMYIGNTNLEGLHHLVNEVLDNSIDEVVAGHAKNIDFHYAKNNTITIKDDGRGIPIDIHKGEKNILSKISLSGIKEIFVPLKLLWHFSILTFVLAFPRI